MAKRPFFLDFLVITSLDEPWIWGQSSILACMVGRLGQESRGLQPAQTKHSLGFVLYRNEGV